MYEQSPQAGKKLKVNPKMSYPILQFANCANTDQLAGLLTLTWVKVQNFQNPEILKTFETPFLKFAVYPLNIHNF